MVLIFLFKCQDIRNCNMKFCFLWNVLLFRSGDHIIDAMLMLNLRAEMSEIVVILVFLSFRVILGC